MSRALSHNNVDVTTRSLHHVFTDSAQSSSVPLPWKGERPSHMFPFTKVVRCFTRSVFLRYRANAVTTTGHSSNFYRYAFPILRTMASASGDGEDVKPRAKPKHTNRLQHSKSPYLLQHKHNPVDWLVLNR